MPHNQVKYQVLKIPWSIGVCKIIEDKVPMLFYFNTADISYVRQAREICLEKKILLNFYSIIKSIKTQIFIALFKKNEVFPVGHM